MPPSSARPTTGRRALLSAGLGGAADPRWRRPVRAEATPDLRWRLACAFPRTSTSCSARRHARPPRRARRPTGASRSSPQAPGEPVPAEGLLEAVAAGTVEMGYGPATLGLAKDPTFALATALPFGLNARGQSAWWLQGGAADLFGEIFAKHGPRRPAGRQYRRADGWLVPSRDQGAGGPPGPEDADRRPRRAGSGQARGGAAGHARARTSTPPSRPRRSTPPNGSAPTTTRSSGCRRSRRPITIRASGRAPRLLHPWIKRRGLEGPAEDPTGRCCRPPPPRSMPTFRPSTTRAIPRALRRLVAGGAQLRPFPQEVMEAGPEGRQRRLCRDRAPRTPTSSASTRRMKTFRNEEYLWFQVAEYTYDNFMIRARARG